MMDAADVAMQYHRDGCVRVRGFFDPAVLSRVRQNIERYMHDIAPRVPVGDRTLEADGVTVRNLWRMEQHDDFFATLAQRRETIDLVAQLVHGPPTLVGVETFNKPARVGSGVPPHQDNAYFCQAPPDVLTIWIAMDAATDENGPIYYIRGSQQTLHPHRPSGVAGNSMGLVTMPAHDQGDIFKGTLDPGDALIHHCQTIHWSAPNKTDHPRCGLLMVYRGSHTRYDPSLREAYEAARAAKA